MLNLDYSSPLNTQHLMARDCVLWLKGVNSLRGNTFYDVSLEQNHLELDVTGPYVWETGKGRELTLRLSYARCRRTLRNLPVTGSRTYLAWFRLDALTTRNLQLIFSHGSNSGQGSRIQAMVLLNQLVPNTASTIFWIEYSGGARWAAIQQDTAWHQLAVTTGVSTNTIQIYLDGQLLPTVINGAAGANINTPAQFGLGIPWDGLTNQFLEGCVDDVRIIKRNLSTEEIIAMYDDSLRLEYAALNQVDDLKPNIVHQPSPLLLPWRRQVLLAGGLGL